MTRVRIDSYPEQLTLVVYSDFGCPRSRESAQALHLVRRRYGDQLRVVFRHLPSPDRASPSFRASEAVEAAGAQGKFWEMHDLLFERQGEFSEEALLRYADELELDVRKFKQELQDGTYVSVIERSGKSSREEGIRSAPSFRIGERLCEAACAERDLLAFVEYAWAERSSPSLSAA